MEVRILNYILFGNKVDENDEYFRLVRQLQVKFVRVKYLIILYALYVTIYFILYSLYIVYIVYLYHRILFIY